MELDVVICIYGCQCVRIRFSWPCLRGNYSRKVCTQFSYPPSDTLSFGSSTAPRSLFWGTVLCSFYAFLLTIFFLFCIPDVSELLTSNGPQPFVFVYGKALGRDGAAFMTALAVLGLICVRPAAFL